jgi:hypothetical protein
MLVVVARGEGGFGAAALRVDPGRVQWAAGQCRATQRQHGYELDIAQRAHAVIGAQLPTLRPVLTQIAGTSSPVVSQTTGNKYAQAATSAVTASQLTGSLRRLPRPLDRVLGRQPHPAHADRWGETIPRR